MNSTAAALATLSLVGIGAVTPLGRDMETISQKLSAPPDAGNYCRVSDNSFTDPALNARLRRADRFSRMAVVAAADAWNSSNSSAIAKNRVGLIVATGFGPHCRGFKFLDGILDCGDNEALPTDFSHSVHGATAAYITEILDLRGPCVTLTDFETGFEQAVLLAQCWLDLQLCDRVLVGAVEEIGEVLTHCASRMLDDSKRMIPGEGAVFLTLAPSSTNGLARLETNFQPGEIDLLLLDDPSIPSRNSRTGFPSAGRATMFSPYFGHTPVSSAFNLLGGFLSLRAGRALGISVGLPESLASAKAAVDNTATFKTSCNSQTVSLILSSTQAV